MSRTDQYNKGYNDYIKGVALKSNTSYNNEYIKGFQAAEVITKCNFYNQDWHKPVNYKRL